MVSDILNSIAKNKMPEPNFIDGIRCQEVLDAVEESIKQKKWIKVKSRV